jgi:hypothetical protein
MVKKRKKNVPKRNIKDVKKNSKILIKSKTLRLVNNKGWLEKDIYRLEKILEKDIKGVEGWMIHRRKFIIKLIITIIFVILSYIILGMI